MCNSSKLLSIVSSVFLFLKKTRTRVLVHTENVHLEVGKMIKTSNLERGVENNV